MSRRLGVFPSLPRLFTGKLVSSDADGLRLSVGFFDDIYIPTHHMPNPNRYEPENSNKNKGTWFLDYGEEIHSSFNFNYTDKIKFQVQSVSYPPIPVEQPKESKPFAPMLVSDKWHFRRKQDRLWRILH
ncbi:hypothetical protein RYX36_008516 [Vicia faba]